jgi:hypothetical protein
METSTRIIDYHRGLTIYHNIYKAILYEDGAGLRFALEIKKKSNA